MWRATIKGLIAHRVRQSRLQARQCPGVCTNCGEPCLPTAVYCDTDCREDDEKREAAERRHRGDA